MRAYDLSPLFRSTIGFDRFNSLLDAVLRGEAEAPSYPPYNIEKVGDDRYQVSMAVAGFGEDDLDVTVRDDLLTVKGRGQDDDSARHYLHRGIARRGFERRFELADHIRVVDATLRNGLLVIDLVREVPEAMKPRTIAIRAEGERGRKPIENKAAA